MFWLDQIEIENGGVEYSAIVVSSANAKKTVEAIIGATGFAARQVPNAPITIPKARLVELVTWLAKNSATEETRHMRQLVAEQLRTDIQNNAQKYSGVELLPMNRVIDKCLESIPLQPLATQLPDLPGPYAGVRSRVTDYELNEMFHDLYQRIDNGTIDDPSVVVSPSNVYRFAVYLAQPTNLKNRDLIHQKYTTARFLLNKLNEKYKQLPPPLAIEIVQLLELIPDRDIPTPGTVKPMITPRVPKPPPKRAGGGLLGFFGFGGGGDNKEQEQKQPDVIDLTTPRESVAVALPTDDNEELESDDNEEQEFEKVVDIGIELAAQLDELQIVTKNLEAEIQNLQTQVNVAEQTNAELEGTLKEMRVRIAALTDQLKQRDAELKEAEADLQKTVDEKQALEAELQQRIDLMSADLNDMTAKLTSKMDENDLLESKLKRLDQSTLEFKQDADDLARQVAQTKSDSDKIENINVILQKEIAEQTRRLEESKRTIQEKVDIIGTLKLEIDKLKEQRDITVDEQRLQTSMEELYKSNKVKLEETIDDLTQKLQEQNRMISVLQTELEEYRDKIILEMKDVATETAPQPQMAEAGTGTSMPPQLIESGTGMAPQPQMAEAGTGTSMPPQLIESGTATPRQPQMAEAGTGTSMPPQMIESGTGMAPQPQMAEAGTGTSMPPQLIESGTGMAPQPQMAEAGTGMAPTPVPAPAAAAQACPVCPACNCNIEVVQKQSMGGKKRQSMGGKRRRTVRR